MEPMYFLLLSFFGPVAFAFLIFFLIVNMNIVQKAGYSGLWAFSIFLPPLYIVLVWVFAFADWPDLVKDEPENTFD